ncbi:MAG: tRNA pseudouridine(55) synthase TruB [Myxococcota bacterium]
MVVPTGLLLVDKPAGLSSHDVVSRVRRRLGIKRVGHAGTLDPAATGLLVLGVGPGTKLLRFIEAEHKTYEATVRLGRSTTTEDAEGETVEEVLVAAGPALEAAVREAALRLEGRLEQTVPAFSAVKVDGERLYRKARRGEEVTRPRRSVEIRCLRVLGVEGPEVHIEAQVSKGTYIRTLGVQLGQAIGLPAHVSVLRRTRIGAFSVEEAHALEEFGVDDLRPLIEALPAWVEVDERSSQRIVRGQPVEPPPGTPDGPVGLVNPRWGLLGVAQRQEANEPLRYLCVLQTPDQVSS